MTRNRGDPPGLQRLELSDKECRTVTCEQFKESIWEFKKKKKGKKEGITRNDLVGL